MKTRYIQLPKSYLSYSQFSLWKADPEKYKKLYFDDRNELRTSNRGQEYGKAVATMLERGEQAVDIVTDTAMSLLKKYDLRDQELRMELKTRDGIVPLITKPDTMDSQTYDFREYKTGKHPWTQTKAQNHVQMWFYAMGMYLKYQKVLDHAYLDWIETEERTITRGAFYSVPFEEKEIVPTGRVETFEVKFTLAGILNMMKEVSMTAKDIEIAWALHVPNPALIF